MGRQGFSESGELGTRENKSIPVAVQGLDLTAGVGGQQRATDGVFRTRRKAYGNLGDSRGRKQFPGEALGRLVQQRSEQMCRCWCAWEHAGPRRKEAGRLREADQPQFGSLTQRQLGLRVVW